MKVIAALLATGFLVVGCSLFVWGLKSLMRRVKRRKYMLVTTGTVLTLETKTVVTSSGEREENASPGKDYNFPVIEFLTDGGQKRTFKSATGIPATGESNIRPGSKVEIAYDRENPDEAFLNDRF